YIKIKWSPVKMKLDVAYKSFNFLMKQFHPEQTTRFEISFLYWRKIIWTITIGLFYTLPKLQMIIILSIQLYFICFFIWHRFYKDFIRNVTFIFREIIIGLHSGAILYFIYFPKQ